MKKRELPLIIRILLAIVCIALLGFVIYGGQVLQVSVQDYLEENNIEASGANALISNNPI